MFPITHTRTHTRTHTHTGAVGVPHYLVAAQLVRNETLPALPFPDRQSYLPARIATDILVRSLMAACHRACVMEVAGTAVTAAQVQVGLLAAFTAMNPTMTLYPNARLVDVHAAATVEDEVSGNQ